MKLKFSVTAIIMTLFIFIFAGCNLTDDNWNKDNTITPYDLIPKPSEHIIYTEYNTKEYCVAKINDMSEEDFEIYISLCKDVGFNLNSTCSSDIFSANNADGFSISLAYDKSFSDCRISVYSPKEK